MDGNKRNQKLGMGQIQYMGFLTQYLGTATDSKGLVELMKH